MICLGILPVVGMSEVAQSETVELENQDSPPNHSEEPSSSKSYRAGQPIEQGWKKRLVTIQVKVAAAKRQLGKMIPLLI